MSLSPVEFQIMRSNIEQFGPVAFMSQPTCLEDQRMSLEMTTAATAAQEVEASRLAAAEAAEAQQQSVRDTYAALLAGSLVLESFQR